ncbi:hypothetical protein BSKO_09227 [Bryopsis sp. KO-2023]|nr:hypothetical protein BSKO_09227 [Bryopsis sp. KO-2023]
MQISTFALTCLLLAAPAFAGRELSQTASNSCSVFGSVSLVVKSGRCKGWAGASCTSHAKAQADIKSAVKALSTVNICDPVEVKAASIAVAKALAQVYVEALAKSDSRTLRNFYQIPRPPNSVSIESPEPKDNSKCGADVVGSSTTKDNVVKVPKVVTPPPTGSGTGSGSTGGSGSAGQVEPCLTIENLDCCFDQDKCGPKGLWAEAPLNPAGNKLVFKRGVSKALCYCY